MVRKEQTELPLAETRTKRISNNIIFASKGYDLRHFIIYTLFFNFRFNFFWYIPISTIFQKTKIILSTILGVLSLSNYQLFSVFLGLLRVVSLLGLLLTDHPWEPKDLMTQKTETTPMSLRTYKIYRLIRLKWLKRHKTLHRIEPLKRPNHSKDARSVKISNALKRPQHLTGLKKINIRK